MINTHASPGRSDWMHIPIPELIDNILSTHHIYTRTALARLRSLLAEAQDQYGNGRPGINSLRRVFAEFDNEMVFHLLKEETLLFPKLKDSVHNSDSATITSFQVVMQVLEQEHRHGHRLMARMRKLAPDIPFPAEAMEMKREIEEKLLDLETDMSHHVHKEDEVLFPRLRAQFPKQEGV